MKGIVSSGGLALSHKALRTHEQPISYLIAAALENPQLVNLAAGLVDPFTLPTEGTARLVGKIMSCEERGRGALQYEDTAGNKLLRKRLLRHLEELDGVGEGGLGARAEHVVVTNGSQQGLYLIADALLDPGDIVIIENPSYFVYTGALDSFGATMLGVPMNDGGMDVEALERLLAEMERDGRLERLKFIYCTSYFQNPTGLSLAADRRAKMVELAKRFSRGHRVLIVEDAAYRELRYDGEAVASIKRYDPENQYTVLTQTFSKPFAPGIKLGYTVMPGDLTEQVLRQKGNHDFGSSSLCQQIALEALNSGLYQRHAEVLCEAYRAKRDVMISAIEGRLLKGVEGVRYVRPAGGLYVWVSFGPHVDTSREGELFRACLDGGVLYVPGDYCFGGQERPRNHLRLSFGQVEIERIAVGIERLARAVQAIAA